ncbi:hypothetical protein [Nonomuraea sp. NPDC005650]|uniref:hypothetical protein n=1 Tax=Nonomuraea sp. NPDC005650 TaxID=3157045 RepID=UPI0033B62902
MADVLPDPHTLLDETEWSRLQHSHGPAAPETQAKLAGLVSGDAHAASIALDHLWDCLFHQGSLYSATPAAALYVAAVLREVRSREALNATQRTELLEWLAEVAYHIGVSRERELEAQFGPDVMDQNPLFSEMRGARPALFQGVYPCISDPDLKVAEAALLAAVHLLHAPELASYREVIAPKVRSVLAVSSWQGHRAAAISGLAAWGEDVGSLKGSTEPENEADDAWSEFWGADRGSIDEPPF